MPRIPDARAIPQAAGLSDPGVNAPLAAFGAAAYFIAFSLAILSAFGNRVTWTLFGIQATGMAVFTVWLLYLQAFVIGAFCQFCLISAATTFGMLLIYVISLLISKR